MAKKKALITQDRYTQRKSLYKIWNMVEYNLLAQSGIMNMASDLAIIEFETRYQCQLKLTIANIRLLTLIASYANQPVTIDMLRQYPAIARYWMKSSLTALRNNQLIVIQHKRIFLTNRSLYFQRLMIKYSRQIIQDRQQNVKFSS